MLSGERKAYCTNYYPKLRASARPSAVSSLKISLNFISLSVSFLMLFYGHNLTILPAIVIVWLVLAPLADTIIAISLTWYLVRAFQPNLRMGTRA